MNPMSRDQLLASVERPVAAAQHDGRDPVVVPLRAAPASGGVLRRPARRAAAASDRAVPRATVAQIADYLGARPPGAADARLRRGAPGLADPAMSAPRWRLAGHARELDQVLCRHVEVQLELIARHAPELAQPVETVLRSLDLLLKLRGQ
jgi:hypothetical protein